MEDGAIIKKTWGEEEVIANTPLYCAKFLHVAPGFACSVHRHPIKTESFHVIAGEGVIGVDQNLIRVQPGQTVHIPQNTYHFFASLSGMTLLEISTHHEDDDCQRATASHPLAWDRDSPVLKKLGWTEGEPLPG